jgi:hypothetical protein
MIAPVPPPPPVQTHILGYLNILFNGMRGTDRFCLQIAVIKSCENISRTYKMSQYSAAVIQLRGTKVIPLKTSTPVSN